ncbi:MAG: rRNA (guanine1207-N2)-methyltransferase [Acidimicrobiaceae bacterium]|nr:rRNA (guanine1207-N2)-methyltransferase [Acidimicrobiaceae bacterium]MDQ1369552.1 rRNA (guanine1207-N2)-methyltransferase [Acidimicrobiaceae bacterium]
MPSRPTEVVLGPDTLLTDRGVFSGNRIDPGTVELLRVVPPPPATGELLDLGCGYGPIALTMAKRAPGATVWAIDTNRRAVALTGENASRLGLSNVRAITPDAVPPELRFAAIWSNPPIRVGKESLHALLLAWLDRLTPDGLAHLVVHKHLGGDSLAAWLTAEGHATKRLASRKGYRLLEVRPRLMQPT